MKGSRIHFQNARDKVRRHIFAEGRAGIKRRPHLTKSLRKTFSHFRLGVQTTDGYTVTTGPQLMDTMLEFM